MKNSKKVFRLVELMVLAFILEQLLKELEKFNATLNHRIATPTHVESTSGSHRNVSSYF